MKLGIINPKSLFSTKLSPKLISKSSHDQYLSFVPIKSCLNKTYFKFHKNAENPPLKFKNLLKDLN